jgi:uncharacterized membrane protein (DUF4010 family)
MAAMAAVTLGFAWYLRSRNGPAGRVDGVPLKNPFSLTAAAKFAAFFALVLLVVRMVQVYAPEHGVYFVAALAGTTDVDAITLSMAEYARTGSGAVAAQAIVIAAFANTVVKAGMSAALASTALRKPVLLAAAAALAAGAGTFLLA